MNITEAIAELPIEALVEAPRMKITVNPKELRVALKIIKPAVASRSTLPVLQCALIVATENKVCITGNNLDMCITANVNALCVSPGVALIDYKQLDAIVKSKKPLTLEVVGETIQVTGGFNLSCKAWDAGEYPDLAILPSDYDKDTVTLSYKDLIGGLPIVAATVADDYSRPVLSSVMMRPGSNGTHAFYGADGFCVVRVQIPKVGDVQETMLIPGKALMSFIKALPYKTETVSFTPRHVHNTQIIVRTQVAEAIIHCVDGTYPNVGYVIEQANSSTTVVEASREGLREAVDQLWIVAKESSYITEWCIGENIVVSAESESRNGDKVKAEVSIVSSKVGKDIDIRLNAQYVLDVLKHIPAAHLEISLSGPTLPISIKADGDRYTYVLMPMSKNR